jgi:hypothetical protein
MMYYDAKVYSSYDYATNQALLHFSQLKSHPYIHWTDTAWPMSIKILHESNFNLQAGPWFKTHCGNDPYMWHI